MRTFCFIFCLCIISFFGCKTESTSNGTTLKKQVEQTLLFSDDFFGIYKGVLKINNTRGEQEIPMEHHLLKTDSTGKYEYKLVYNGQQARNYFLIEKNKEKGFYEIDENNGIMLPTYLNNNTLHSFLDTTFYLHV